MIRIDEVATDPVQARIRREAFLKKYIQENAGAVLLAPQEYDSLIQRVKDLTEKVKQLNTTVNEQPANHQATPRKDLVERIMQHCLEMSNKYSIEATQFVEGAIRSEATMEELRDLYNIFDITIDEYAEHIKARLR